MPLFTTLSAAILDFESRPSARPAFRYKIDGEWHELSWQEYFDRALALASFLMNQNLHKGDRVAIAAETQLSWSLADAASILGGFTVVPIYSSLSKSEMEIILEETQPKIMFLGISTVPDNLSSMDIENRALCPKIIVTFADLEDDWAQELSLEGIRALSLESAIAEGRENLAEQRSKIISAAKKTTPADRLTIIYTSGTTGRPKGVVLNHEQAMSEINETFPLMKITAKDTSLSFLPYAHVLGRVEHWGQIAFGFTIAFADSIESLRADLVAIKPTVLVSVPRVFEKIQQSLLSHFATKKIEGALSKKAFAIAYEAKAYSLKGQPIPTVLWLEMELAKKLVLNVIKNAFGGRLRFAICGGAPLSAETMKFFYACDVLILEGYGLTETTAAITINTPFNYHFGCVGKPIGDVKLKIADDGEILVKSKKVMQNYYLQEKETNSVFVDGWFKTGDIGEILPSGELRITDRKKDLIKTAGGKYVAPQKIEGLILRSPLISHALIYGDRQKYLVALLTLNPKAVTSLLRSLGDKIEDWQQAIDSKTVQEEIKKAITSANQELASFETIKRYAVLPNDFSISEGEITPSLKLKRKHIEKKYIHHIENLYI